MTNSSLFFQLSLPTPKKNNKSTFARKDGSVGIRSSTDYLIWHKCATEELKAYTKPPTIEIVKRVRILFCFPDYRTRDLTNFAESIMDLLVDNAVIKDDSWTIVPEVTLIGKHDPANPRAEVLIEY